MIYLSVLRIFTLHGADIQSRVNNKKRFCFSRVDFLNRVKKNETLKRAAKEAGQPAPDCKRVAKQVIPGHVVVAGETNQPQVLGPIPYEFVA